MKGDRATILMHKDGKILMIQRLRNGNEYYVLPGGKIEEGESAEEAATRELTEETTIIGTLVKKLTDFPDEDDRIHYIYLFDYVSGTPKLAPGSPEITETSKDNIYTPLWVDLTEVEHLRIWPDKTKPFLLDYFAKKN